MQEKWRPIKGYEGLYEVSDLGRVRTLDRFIEYFAFGRTIKKHIDGLILSAGLDGTGYFSVCLRKNKINKRATVHTLVAKTFIPNPMNKKTVNHKNGIKTDNRADNLEWTTQYENVNHAIKNGLIKREKPVVQIKNGIVLCEYESEKTAGEQMRKECAEKGIAIGKRPNKTISLCILGLRKSAYGYQWKFKEKEPE